MADFVFSPKKQSIPSMMVYSMHYSFGTQTNLYFCVIIVAFEVVAGRGSIQSGYGTAIKELI